jgi:magnesium-transporting ATPase (P-type)
LKDAGIKVWVLTGDKVATGINIAKGAGLIDDSNTSYVIFREDIPNDFVPKMNELEELIK